MENIEGEEAEKLKIKCPQKVFDIEDIGKSKIHFCLFYQCLHLSQRIMWENILSSLVTFLNKFLDYACQIKRGQLSHDQENVHFVVNAFGEMDGTRKSQSDV